MLQQLRTEYRSFKKKEMGVMHSHEIKEIISNSPSRLIRWGGVIAVSLLLSVCALALITPYPEKKRIDIKIVNTKAEYTLYGKPVSIKQISVKNGQLVKQGQLLVVLRRGYNLSLPKNHSYKNTSLVLSPDSGIVIFLSGFGRSANKKKDQPLLSINSAVSNPYGEFTCLIPDSSFIKLKDPVTVKFQNKNKQIVTKTGVVETIFPAPAKGVLKGKVKFGADFYTDLRINGLRVTGAEVIMNRTSVADKLVKVIFSSNRNFSTM